MTPRLRLDGPSAPRLVLFIAALAGCVPLDRYSTTRADAEADRAKADLVTPVDAEVSDLPATPLCPVGFDRCAGDICTDVRASADHCGTCGNVCALANAVSACESGACVVAACDPGFADCDGNPATGCETNTSTSTARCGRCDRTCPTAGGTPVCRDGVCRIATCAAGFADCDGSDANGCETDTSASLTHCGACGRACVRPNATAACVAGACQVSACTAGFGDCDLDPANGCETALLTNTAHCGACGRPCASAGGVANCAAGACGLACAAGRGDCDVDPANGCETDLAADGEHCGACGRVCTAGTSCSAGTCATGCSAGEVSCSGACVNVRTSAVHCGACGRACTAAPAHAAARCADGACSFACLPGFGDCNLDPTDGCETSLVTNPLHCGMCRRGCPVPAGTAPACADGVCASPCLSGQGDCDGNATNGCETSLLTTAASCGACGRACAVANATPTCLNGACAIRACNAGFGDCDGNAANGCEVNTQTSNPHCGGCGRTCVLARATAACREGTCRVAACNAGFGDCDGDAANGCEVNLATTPAHCGGCGGTCAASCVGGACCGASGEPCCGGACTAGACVSGRCNALCGGAGQPCCAGACATGTVCIARTTPPTCVACGLRGQPCCASNVCREGMCRSNSCM